MDSARCSGDVDRGVCILAVSSHSVCSGETSHSSCLAGLLPSLESSDLGQHCIHLTSRLQNKSDEVPDDSTHDSGHPIMEEIPPRWPPDTLGKSQKTQKQT